MHLKLLFTVLSLMFMSDNGGSGGGDDGDGKDDVDDKGKVGSDRGKADDKGGDDGDGKGDEDVAGLKSALAKERRNGEALAKRLKKLEDAGKSDADKTSDEMKAVQDERDAALKKLQVSNGKVAVTAAASKANAIDPLAVFAIVRDNLDYDDDGEPTNVSTALKDARTAHPALFRGANGDGDAGKGGNSGGTKDINSLIRRAAGKSS